MVTTQFTNPAVRAEHYTYPDRDVIAIDFGPDTNPTIDVLEDTLLIVIDDDTQHEIDLPPTTEEVFNHNGIVTIETKPTA